jgi:protein-tyrosine phosphatase
MLRIRRRLTALLEHAVFATGFWQEGDARWQDCNRLIFVCTGNICRSPYAEAAARRLGIAAISSGIDTQEGLPADPTAIAEAARRGLNLSSHRTTRWQDVEVHGGDIIIAMQLRHAVAVLPRIRKTNCQAVVLSSLLLPKYDLIFDPYGQPLSDYVRVFELIDTALQCIVERMGGERSGRE